MPTDCSIAWCATEQSFALAGAIFGPDHELLDTPDWLASICEWSGYPDLFLMRHRVSGNFVLCQWIHPPGRYTHATFNELNSFETIEEMQHLPHDWWVERLIDPDEASRRLAAKIRDLREVQEMLENESLEERNDTAKWLRRNGQHEIAAELSNHLNPYMGRVEAAHYKMPDFAELFKPRRIIG